MKAAFSESIRQEKKTKMNTGKKIKHYESGVGAQEKIYKRKLLWWRKEMSETMFKWRIHSLDKRVHIKNLHSKYSSSETVNVIV